MNNFFELEKKCKKYHRQKLIPIYILFLLILVSIVVLYFLFSNKKAESKKNTLDKNVTHIVLKKKISNKVIKKENNKTNKKVVFKEEYISKKIPTLKVELDLNGINDDNYSITQKLLPKQIKQPIQIEVKPKEAEPKKLIITKELPSFEKSFALMNLYFNDRNYVKAKKWAISASKVKPYNEDVWNIYALSLYYLHKKQKAIEVLESYLKYKNSKKLENTLKKIKQGKNR
jgi:hypothetical protein